MDRFRISEHNPAKWSREDHIFWSYTTAKHIAETMREQMRTDWYTFPTVDWYKYSAVRIQIASEKGWEGTLESLIKDHPSKFQPEVMPWDTLGLSLIVPENEAPLGAHFNETEPGKVFYYTSINHVCTHRVTSMTAARFAIRYYGATNDQAEQIAQIVATQDSIDFHIATEKAEIVEVYLNGPNSCMSHSVNTYSSAPHHPVEVYGGESDIQLAYIKRAGRITGRCLVWPDKMSHGRIYGDYARMEKALSEAGYEPDDFNGAKLSRINHNGYIVGPYLDDCQTVKVYDDHLLISWDGDLEMDSTSGLYRDTSGRCRCERCNGLVDADDLRYIDDIEEQWCDYCADRCSFYCEYSEQQRSGYDYTTVRVGSRPWDTKIWDTDFVAGNAFYCDETEQYYSNDYMSFTEMADGRIVCDDWFVNYGGTCLVDDLHYDLDDLRDSDYYGGLVHVDVEEPVEDNDTAPATCQAGVNHIARQGRDEHPDQLEMALQPDARKFPPNLHDLPLGEVRGGERVVGFLKPQDPDAPIVRYICEVPDGWVHLDEGDVILISSPNPDRQYLYRTASEWASRAYSAACRAA